MIYRLLIEMQHLRKVLTETRMDFLRKRYLPLIQKAIEDPRSPLKSTQPPAQWAENLFTWAVNLDPDPSKKYSQWILNLLSRSGLMIEDGYKVADYLSAFDRLKPHLPIEQRDINHYKTIQSLYDVILDNSEEKSQRQVDREQDAAMHREADVLYDDAQYKIVIPKTEEASCYFGRSTQWCTAASHSDNAFEDYYLVGDLYIILDKRNNKRWQYQSQDNILMDERDNPVDPKKFAVQHPVIAAFFTKSETENEVGKVAMTLQRTEFAPKERMQLHAITLRHGRGVVFKEAPGLQGHTIAYVTPQGEGYVEVTGWSQVRGEFGPTGAYDSSVDPDDMAAVLNTVGLIGNEHGDVIFGGVYFRNDQWGTLRQFGKPYAKSASGQWIGLEVKPYAAKAITRLGFYHGNTDTKLAAMIQYETLTVLDYSEHPSASIKPIMALIKARNEIKFWDMQDREPDFSDLSEADQQWLLQNRPTLCPPTYAYPLLGATDDLKQTILFEIGKHYHQWGTIAPRWIGDKLLVAEWPDIMEALEYVGPSLKYQLSRADDAKTAAIALRLKKNRYLYYGDDDGKLRKGLKLGVPYVYLVAIDKVIDRLRVGDVGTSQYLPWTKYLGLMVR